MEQLYPKQRKNVRDRRWRVDYDWDGKYQGSRWYRTKWGAKMSAAWIFDEHGGSAVLVDQR